MNVSFFLRRYGELLLLGWFLLAAGCAETREAKLPAENLPVAGTETGDIDGSGQDLEPLEMTTPDNRGSASELATFGAGCFWCVEAVFQEIDGVTFVKSGYAGGAPPNPTYEQVCSGLTGHAEVCQIGYDPAKVSYDELLEVFWKTHDPTTLNRQGPDTGTQYRSVIFYHNDQQRSLAEEYKKELDKSGAFNNPIVTEISPYPEFYEAEEHHQNFYKLNPRYGYCQMIIAPKMEKLRKVFKDKLKEDGGGH